MAGVRSSIAAVLAFAATALLGAAHAGDNFPGTTITGSAGSISASNATATGQPGEPTTYGEGALDSMWYSWTAPSDGLIIFETCSGTNFDTTLQTFTGGAVNALSQVTRNDDACGLQSRNTVTVTAGTTYRVQVDGYGSNTGTFTLAWAFTPSGPAVPPAPTTTQSCSALTGAWSGGTAASGGIGVTRTLSAGSGASWSPSGADTMNTINAWSEPAVQGQAAIVEIFNWTSTSDTASYTLDFAKPVTNPVIHIDRVGGIVGGVSNTSVWELTSAGTLYRLAGATHFETYSDNTFYRTVGETTSSAESSLNSATGTASGSIMIEGTHSSVSFQLTGDQVGNGSGGDAVEIVICLPQADLELEKVVDNAAPAQGSTVTFTLTLTNNGPEDAPGVVVTDLLPAGLAFVSATPSQGSYDDTTGLWDVGTIANGAALTLQVSATVTGSGTITNEAEVTASGYTDPDSDPNDAAGDDYASADITVAVPTTISCGTGSSATGSGFAVSGSGQFTEEVFWLDWDCPGNATFPAGSTVTRSWDVGDGTVVSATLTGPTFSLQPYDTGSYFDDTLPGLYGGLNPIGLRGSFNAETPQFDISFSATHNGVPIDLDYVFADAETTSPGESIVVTTSGSAFTLLEQSGAIAVAGAGSQTVTLSNGGSPGTALLETTGSPTLSTSLNQGGLQAVAFGVRFRRDFSDAPTSGYGGASHRRKGLWRLGAGLTTETADYNDPNAAGDADDGVTLPTLTQGEGATIPVSVSQPGGNGGYLQGWIDWNGDGDFADPGEQVASDLQSGSGGTSTINVPVTVPANATTSQTFARFRWSTTSGLDSTSAAPDGEVEDYALTVQPADGGTTVSPLVCPAGAASLLDWQGEDWTPGALSGVFSVDAVGIDITVLDPQGALSGTPNGPTPVNGPFYQGGLASVESSLILELDDADLALGDTTIRIDFDRPVNGARLSLFDIDFSALGPRIERASVTASLGGGSVPVDLQGGPAVLVSGNHAYGIAESDPTGAASGEGTVLVGVDGMVDRIEIAYGHGAGTDRASNPGNPGFSLHDVSFCTEADRSDAPVSGTAPDGSGTIAYGEAVHGLAAGYFLGAAVDADAAPIANADASGDGADDDGVTLGTIVPGQPMTIDVVVNGANGVLRGWIDWNGDGDFDDANEVVLDDEQTLTGTVSTSYTVPSGAITGTPTFARFRWSTRFGMAPDGPAPDGEAEDYLVTVGSAQLSASKSVDVLGGVGSSGYALPGEDVIYTITVTNVGSGAADADTIQLIDALPDDVEFYNGTSAVFGGEAIGWSESGTGLSFAPASDVGFSDQAARPAGFADCTYTPLAGSYDDAVTYVCFNPKGSLATGDPDPSFSVSFRARIK